MNLTRISPKVLLPLVATALLAAGCSQNKKAEEQVQKSSTEQAFNAVVDGYFKRSIFDNFDEGYFTDDAVKQLDTIELNELRDSVNNITTEDSANFVNKENKTYQDTVNMLKSFKTRDKANAAVEYLKEQQAQVLNAEAEQRAAKQAEIDALKADLENRMQ